MTHEVDFVEGPNPQPEVVDYKLHVDRSMVA